MSSPRRLRPLARLRQGSRPLQGSRRRPGAGARSGSRPRQVFRQQRPAPRWKQVGAGLLLGAAGAGVVVGLLQLPRRFDTLLLLSTALANGIRGIQLLLLGLVQMLAMVVLVALAVGALVLLLAGLVRVVRGFLPRPKSEPKRPSVPR